jgi:hypothetical protein
MVYPGLMRLLLCLLAGLAGLPALADATGPGGKVLDCYCTDTQGARVEMDEEICLVVGGRAFIARCEMSLNNPIWRDTGRACVSSSLAPFEPLEPARDAGGVHAEIAAPVDEV